MMQQASNGLLSVSPATSRDVVVRGFGVRPTLPARNVTSATLEDAYVRFILYCNPAVPLDTDTATLRESFRTPPKSGGKSFSTFTLLELIRQLEGKQLKTWAELALKLGVEPPDQDKGQSSQKIQQYAVRLKRWMHSMHVDAFFEYLLNNQHPYWTQVPSNPNPVGDILRDGVAAEDDMALRALLPQIRPRRGRRKHDDDDVGRSPSQRPRLDSPMNESFSAVRQERIDPWSAQPDGRNPFNFAQLTPVGQPPSATPWPQDVSQTPLTAYPQSAITPSFRQAFWADEPKSATTPNKSRSTGRRHGAKVVSSAWRSSAPGTGKTRGRPPIKRTMNDGPFSAFSTENPASFRTNVPLPAGMMGTMAPMAEMTASPIQETHPMASQTDSAPTSAGPRLGKPGRLSLQVPERLGGEVRLATPPPVVMVNGEATPVNGNSVMSGGAQEKSVNFFQGTRHDIDGSAPPVVPPQGISFKDSSDKTNMNELESFFVQEILAAAWIDGHGNPIPPVGVEEAEAITATVVENLLKAATTKEGFLINLAALAGGKILKTTTFLRCTKQEVCADHTKYICNWELRFGDIRGQFSMKETVSHDKWKKPYARDDGSSAMPANGEAAGASFWQKKYQELLGVVKDRDEELESVRGKVIQGLKDPKRKPLDPP